MTAGPGPGIAAGAALVVVAMAVIRAAMVTVKEYIFDRGIGLGLEGTCS